MPPSDKEVAVDVAGNDEIIIDPGNTPCLSDAEVEEMLCKYAVVLDEAKEKVAEGKLDEAGEILQELKESDDCEVCQEVIDEVINANDAAINCEGDCPERLAKLHDRIEWAKEAFCPTTDEAE